MFDPSNPQDVLARTMWGEARGGGAAEMMNVGCVIMNRVAHGGWWGDSVIKCCLKPWQFSCWNGNDPNRAKLLTVADTDPQFKIALDIAAKLIAGTADTTNGADSYVTLKLFHKPPPRADGKPNWWENLTPVALSDLQAYYQTV